MLDVGFACAIRVHSERHPLINTFQYQIKGRDKSPKFHVKNSPRSLIIGEENISVKDCPNKGIVRRNNALVKSVNDKIPWHSESPEKVCYSIFEANFLNTSPSSGR